MNYAWRSIVLLALGLLATGCVTSAEQQAQRNEERCLARGYQPKTDAYSDCLVRLETERDTLLQQRHREAAERNGIPSTTRGY